MQARLDTARGDRCLCRVSWEAEPENPDTHTVEVVYEVHRPAEDDFTIDGDPYFMERLSCTRTDTRETVGLDPETERKVKQVVIRKVTDSKLWGVR